MEYYILKFTASLLIILCCCFCFCLQPSYGATVLFSSLPQTLTITASPNQAQVLNAGEDTITLTWGLNQSLPAAGTDDYSYRELKVKLCYAPISQLDRGWRKTVDNLSKDKTCQFTIFEGPYQRNQRFEWRIEKDVPAAVYFVRAYAFNSAGEEVAYGQTTDAKKRDRLFEIQAISGRHLSLDIASGCFSAFSLLSLIGFYVMEKRKN